MNLPRPFPPGLDVDDYNPAIRLFGMRFINNQSMVELALEFLALVFSEKRLGQSVPFQTAFPSWEQLKEWPDGTELKYKLLTKLTLKLFAFLGSSRVDGRHPVHKRQFEKLYRVMGERIISPDGNPQKAIEYLEDFLRGFRGAGFNRAWCAQSFYPLSPSLMTHETIWNESYVKKQNSDTLGWNYIVDKNMFTKFFSTSKHDFMARGGELLYLQLCNVFHSDASKIEAFGEKMGFSPGELNLQELHRALQENMPNLSGIYTGPLDCLVDFIEDLDPSTRKNTNREQKFLSCKWCPEESWAEGYLFAVELLHLLQAPLDPIERMELFITGCNLQVLRSLCAQSIRYAKELDLPGTPGGLGYAWIFSSPDSGLSLRRASQRNLQVVLGVIQKALRDEELQAWSQNDTKHTLESLNKEADTKYGHKLLLTVGKRLGIIVPQTGQGARFVMTDAILRYLVLTLLAPGQACTYEDFLNRVYMHYGIAVEGDELAKAVKWSGWPANRSVQPKDSRLSVMLRAGGFLTELSDACSIVENPFSLSGNQRCRRERL